MHPASARHLKRGLVVLLGAAPALVACAARTDAPVAQDGPRSASSVHPANATATVSAGARVSNALPVAPAPRDPAAERRAIFASLKGDLDACYQRGRTSAPLMLDGKVTLNGTADGKGTVTCVIPSEDSGLTHEVEDCMAARLAREPLDVRVGALTLPLVVRGGVVALADAAPETVSLQSVETHRMSDAFGVLGSLEPSLAECLRGLDRSLGVRAILVGARVRSDGRNQCALAMSPSGKMPVAVGECLAGVLREAVFPPPKGGAGLVLVPVHLL